GFVLLYFLGYFVSHNIIPNVFYEIFLIIIILGISYLVTRFIGSIIYNSFIGRGESFAKHIRSTFELIFFLIVLFIVLLSLGENITAGLVGAGIVGIILGVAAQASLSNFFAGLYILLSKPFEVGQRINVVTSQYSGFGPTYHHDFIPPKFTGTVDEVGFLYTKIINDENHIMTIPNSVFLQAMIINYQKNEYIKIKVMVEIPLKMDPEKIKDSLNEIVKRDGKINGEIEMKLISMDRDYYNAAIYVKERHEKMDEVNDYILRCLREIIY
ncbi:MAG: mechanosensitive ion channel, partial [Euryarchaeota archaeon]|nr:mechanosensitive ion channel [Euryarchaeota archaeon]